MFTSKLSMQFERYNNARNVLIDNPEILINLERYLIDHVSKCIIDNLADMTADYNEASYLHPFWKNYPPEDRGRQPIKDQYPWIEVGEHAIGCKLPRILEQHFNISDGGIPAGADQRFILSHKDISAITNNLTDTAWLFIDIKSIGPRDDQDHTVMSHNQVSGDGTWDNIEDGVLNEIMTATGKRTSHDFHCSMPPLFVLSDGTIAPLIIFALKPVYRMLPATQATLRNGGQPLDRIDLACIPNGLLLTKNPNYLDTYPNLLFPGKDDKSKDPRKLRARVSFNILRDIGTWRYRSIKATYP